MAATVPGVKQKQTKQLAHLPHPVHKIVWNVPFLFFVFATLVSCFGSSECERERGGEGSCLSGVDEGLSEGCDLDHE